MDSAPSSFEQRVVGYASKRRRFGELLRRLGGEGEKGGDTNQMIKLSARSTIIIIIIILFFWEMLRYLPNMRFRSLDPNMQS